ncbi:SusC/RagA family TonB-linked outer membrane protein [Muribaculum intestinale]|uniref:SusC/RagA family TonB-linked outer membrane protein n=1 Tax=Muribaculum intestinale TaxID=1796646 RepID=UPI0012B98CFF|nr:TonB-dependent receptor [Muribaculum intestinale]
MLNQFCNFRKVYRYATVLLALGMAMQPAESYASPADKTATQAVITVKGQVSDSSNEPLIGATVRVKGHSDGVMTDIDGKFSISAPANGTIVVTYVGMTTREIPVNGRQKIDITLDNNAVNLDDVVVIGYGTQSRATVTSAITKVKAEDMAVMPSNNVMSMLQGKVPGMQVNFSSGRPGVSPAVTIRGGTTTTPGSDAPLYIIDGVIRTITDLNYADIESVEVLKDAASTAIYGAKAANGIVMITTKQGKKGAGRISVSYGLSIDHQPKRIPISDAREYLSITREAATRAYNPDKYLNGSFGMSTNNVIDSYVNCAFLDDWITRYGQGYVENLLTNRGWETMEDPATPGKMLLFKNEDFQDNLMRNPINHDFNINFSGGNDRGTYYMSLGYLKQDGIVIGNDYDRWSFTANGSYKVMNNVTVRSSVNYISRKFVGLNENNVMARASLMPPTTRQYYEDGRPAPGENTASFRTRLHEVYYQSKYNAVDRANLMAQLDWEPIKDLHIRPQFSFRLDNTKNHQFERANEVQKSRIAKSERDMNKNYQYEIVANYKKTLWNKNNFDFMVGYTHTYTDGFDSTLQGMNGTSDKIETINGVGELNLSNTSTVQSYKKMSSYFGRINYNYDMKYLLSLSIRYDGSSHFAENHKYGTFPGISAGWNVHREAFFEKLTPVVNNFKIRGSWGKAGNDNLSLANTQGKYAAGNNYGGEAGLLNTVLANSDLLWEETTSADLGFDLGLFNNRISLTFDVYRKETSNRLIDEKLWSETGFSSIKSNYGSLITKGLETSISATAIQTRDFTWDIDAGFAFFRTIVGKLPNNGVPRNRINGGVIFDEKLGKYIEVGGLAEGERFGAQFAFKMDGVYATDEEAAGAPYDNIVHATRLGQGKVGGDAIWHDFDKNGIIDQYDMYLCGYINPDHMGSFNNTFRYKNFTLRVMTDFSGGNVIDNRFRAQANGNLRHNYATLHETATSATWHKQGDIATIPRYDCNADLGDGKRNHVRGANGANCPLGFTSTYGSNEGTSNSLYISKGDYLAFREVSLTYMLRNKFLQRNHLDNVTLTAAVYNLGYITAYEGLTPEIIGADLGQYPRPRSFLFTLNFTLK